MSKIKWFGPVVAVVLLALAMGSPTLSAKGKPGGGGGGGGGVTPAGTVYFFAGADQLTANADGNNAAYLPANVVDGTPSVGLHNGSGWMVLIRPVAGTYLNGRQRQEVFIVREDGNETDTVQLTNDPSFEPMWKQQPSQQPPRWATDGEVLDGKVSFMGWEYDANGDMVGAGIYSQQVAYDFNDNPAGPLNNRKLLVPLATYDPDPEFPNDPGDPVSGWHSWSPSGEALAYDNADPNTRGSVYIHDLATDTSTFLADGGGPAWSPDGSLIAYSVVVNTKGSGDLMTISPSGGEPTMIVPSGARKKFIRGLSRPVWSPDSQHLVYQLFEYNRTNGRGGSSIIRVTRTGSDAVTIVSNEDFNGPAHSPNAWR